MDGEAGWWTTSGNIGLPPLARAMGVGRQQQGLGQRSQTQYMDSSEEAIPDVPNDNDHELFDDYMDIDDTQRETTRTRGIRVIKRPTNLDDYGV